MSDILPFQKFPGVMVDLETLSTRADAAIVSIGAVKFSYSMGISSRFKVNISGSDCHKHGLHLCPDTIDWWSKQSKDAQDGWKLNPQSLTDGLQEFLDWWGPDKNQWFYCNGLSFDAPVLRTALEKVGFELPWHYRNEMDIRTMYKMVGFHPNKKAHNETTYHDALADAEFQTKELLELFEVVPF